MKKLLQINVTANWGSTGKIAEQIGQMALQQGWESYIAYGRMMNPSQSKLIKIGNRWDVYMHYALGRFFDMEGLCSKKATQKLVRDIDRIKPDVIHLHNIHDHYLNFPILFEYLRISGIPVVWTLHDVWATTGHCAINKIGCEKWTSHCSDCPLKSKWSLDKSQRNYIIKKRYFDGIDKLAIVSVSDWLNSQVAKSFLRNHQLHVIKNGVDLDIFKPSTIDIREKYHLDDRKIILGVASVWDEDKGLYDFYKLSDILPNNWVIVLVGFVKEKVSHKNIIYIPRTQNQQDLAAIYSEAHVLLSLSRSETFGLTIAESMACGTPAIVYDNTAQPELVSEETGSVVSTDNIDGVLKSLERFKDKSPMISEKCRERAISCFDMNKVFRSYISLYDDLIM